MSTPVSAETTLTSAPATETPVVESHQELLNHATKEELSEWSMKGTLPKAKPAKSETPAETGASATPEESADTTAAASAAAPKTERNSKTKEDSERRWKELSENYGSAQRRIEELERRLLSQPAASSDKPASQPVAETAKAAPTLEDVDANGKAKYQTLADWQKAYGEWMEENILSKVESRQTKAQQEKVQADNKAALDKRANDQFATGRKNHADFDEVALNKELPIAMGSVVDIFILDSDFGHEILYELGKNPEELKRINGLHPIRQARELSKMEAKFSGATSATEKTERLIPKLPAPVTELSARNTRGGDEAEAALARGDTSAYMRIVNAREIASRKG